ncbi:MAG: hypothetical protein Q8L98_03795 [Chlamydiales bacterium]|nr:hypothetical protein [Chlamydiales bacterium]
MRKGLLIKLGFCLLTSGSCLYSYFDKQNELTQMKIRLPQLEKEIHVIREESRRLHYQVDQFESPSHLMELARSPEFSHLKHPLLREILTVPEDIVAQAP